MDNGLVTSDGTKVLTVAEYDRFVNFIPIKFRPIFKAIQLQAFGTWSFKGYMIMKNSTIQKELRAAEIGIDLFIILVPVAAIDPPLVPA